MALQDEGTAPSSIRGALGIAIKMIEAAYHRQGEGAVAAEVVVDLLERLKRPGLVSVGKQEILGNLVADIILHTAEARRPVLLMAGTVNETLIIEALLARLAQVDWARCRAGDLKQRDWVALTKAASRLSQAPIWIDGTHLRSPQHLEALLTSWRGSWPEAAAGPALLIVREPAASGWDVAGLIEGLQAIVGSGGLAVLLIAG